jgi:hypothetical protein
MEDDRARDQTSSGEKAPPPHRPRRKWPLVLVGIFVVLPIVGLSLWTAIALNWSYSEGNRAGYLQKFSKKGWLCKTWEGEITMNPIPGSVPEKFAFSVRDDSVAKHLTALIGERVAITYNEHPGIPTKCFGETRYFVVDAKQVK